MVIEGSGPSGNITRQERVLLQAPNEILANTGSGDTLMGNGIDLELDLAALTSSTTLTLIDNLTTDPVKGFFENPSLAMDLYEEGALISGTGFGGTVSISYIGGIDMNDVVLTLIAGGALAGDYNANGVVDAADYTVWRDTLGSTTDLAADGDGNTVVDAGDYTVWKSNFGAGAPGSGSASATVPEPATMPILAILALSMTIAPRRCSRAVG
jgi:hypothetical protein